MLTDIDVDQLLERVKALEVSRDAQREFDLEFRAALLKAVAVIERRWKIGKYQPEHERSVVKLKNEA